VTSVSGARPPTGRTDDGVGRPRPRATTNIFPRKWIFPTWPAFEPDEIAAAATALRSGKVNYWTGEQGQRFEEEYAATVGCAYGVALANGTVALEIALRALGVGPGDEVIVPARTFIATASCAVAVGARPVVVDVDPDSQNLTAETVAPAVTTRTRAIIAVHLGGRPADMPSIMRLAHDRRIPVVEDCAQAHGATLDGRPVGSLGDIAAWSFCQDKILTTGGEGGMITTNDPGAYRFAWEYKDHGRNLDGACRARSPEERGFRWVHDSYGTNARMHELGAAVGRAALPRLPRNLATRQANAAILNEYLHDLPALRIPTVPPSIGHAYYRWYAFVRPALLVDGWTRDRLLGALVTEGIPCSVGSCGEIYRERAFPEEWRPAVRLPVAACLGATSLALPVHPTLRPADMRHMANVVAEVLSVATGG
jgi:dTDP-4-amino-4,6-dideoxygalactose transaminase